MITNNKEQKDSLEKISASFEVDAEGLGSIGEAGMLTEILTDFIDYPDFLRRNNKATNTRKLIKKLSCNTGIIHANNKSPLLKRIFYYAHIAACCEMFSGWQIALRSINRADMLRYVQESLLPFNASPSSDRTGLIKRIHISDTVRIIQILRMLGLYRLPSSQSRQLSFAAGMGDRDLDGVHMIPYIRMDTNALSKTSCNSITFNRQVGLPENLILIDNDPEFASHFQYLTESNREWMLALNEDAVSAMNKLPDMVQIRSWKPVNLIVGIRIDHRMIPDTQLFFSQLKPLLDEQADLIFTIGAGHSLDEFRGRKQLMQAMFDYFKQRGMSPVKIVLHGGKTLEQQRLSPSFGLSNYTSYEILYCKLLKKRL